MKIMCILPCILCRISQFADFPGRVSAQRQEYKLFRQGKRCRLTPDKVQALNSIGFCWQAQRGNNRKKSPKKKRASIGATAAVPVEGASLDGNRALAASLSANASHSNFGRFPPHNNLSRPDIPPALLLSHVLSLLDAQQQSSGPQAAQRGASEAAAAARMMENILAQQNRNVMTAPTSSSTFPPGLLPGAAVPPPLQAMARAAALPNHVTSQVEGLAFAHAIAKARHLQDSRHLANMSSRNYQEQDIAKDLIDAIRQGKGIGSMGPQAAARQIHGMIGRQDNTARPSFSVNDAQRTGVMPQMQSLPPRFLSRPPTYATARADRSESESEASKFGVALQMGDVVAPTRDLLNVGMWDGMSTRVGDSAGRGTAGTNSSQPDWEDRKLPARPDIGSRNDHLSDTQGNNVSTTGGSDSSHQSDDGGVFSDAEEDEIATAFLEAAKRSYE